MRGKGNVGKTTTIRAMCQEPFQIDLDSTCGADTKDLEVKRTDMRVDGGGGKLEAYTPDAAEHALAIAASAAARLRGDGGASAATAAATSSLLDRAVADEAAANAAAANGEAAHHQPTLPHAPLDTDPVSCRATRLNTWSKSRSPRGRRHRVLTTPPRRRRSRRRRTATRRLKARGS